MVDRGDRRAGAFHDDVDGRVAHQRAPVVTHVRVAVAQRGVEAGRLHALRLPAHAFEVAAGGLGAEVGDAQQVHARRARNLRQVHAAELAGANQADADRAALGRALLQLAVQAALHAASRVLPITSIEVASALPGMPPAQGRSTG